jgi:hypothetical protein
MCIALYTLFSRLPGPLRPTSKTTTIRTLAPLHSNRKYLTKDGYEDGGNTPDSPPPRQSKPEQSNTWTKDVVKQSQTTGYTNLLGKPVPHWSFWLLPLESHETASTTANADSNTQNTRIRMGQKWCTQGKHTSRPLWTSFSAARSWPNR